MNSKPAKKTIASPRAFQGTNLRDCLKRAGITKYRLAKDCGISYRTIQYWEKGHSIPSKENWKKVQEYLGLTVPVDDGHADILARLQAIESKLKIK